MKRVKSTVSEGVSKLPIPNASDRKLYLGFWFIFGCGALAYFIYVAIKCADSYKNPGASIEVEPTQPKLPIYAVCFETGFVEEDYYTPAMDDWQAGRGPAPNDVPVAIAYWNFSDDPLYNYERFRYFTEEYQNYCNFGCDCIQVNMYNEINKNKGKVEIYASGNYNLTTAQRSVAYLFVRPQELGRFKNGSSDEKYDNLNLPTGTHVDASWAVSKRISISGWVPYKENTDISYGMTQQVEPLTKSAAQALLKGLSTEKSFAVCENHALNATCTLSGATGFCNDNGVCSWRCLNNVDVIPVSYICDGELDCSDDSDEIPTNCPPKFNCTDGKQAPPDARCNGVVDCKDGSDEDSCPNLPITVSISVAPYVPEVTVVKATVTFGWDVALAAFKSVLELAVAAMAFLFPAYFLAEPELRRFILRKGEKEAESAEKKSSSAPNSPATAVEMNPLQGDQE